MKKSIMMVLVSIIPMVSMATEARVWRPSCGFADDTLSYIRQVAGEVKSGDIPCYPKQGESGRHILFYPNGDWLVTLDFYTLNAVEKDVICVVASGHQGDDSAVEWTTKIIEELPAERLMDFGKDPADLEPLKSFRGHLKLKQSDVPTPLVET